MRAPLAILTLAVMAAALPVAARSRRHEAPPPPPPAPSKGPMCSPLFVAGVVLGISERSDVVAIHGPGTPLTESFRDEAMAWSSPDGTECLAVDFGTDRVAARIALKRCPPGATYVRSARPWGARQFCGPSGALRLGLTQQQVRAALGDPQGFQSADSWEYLTDYGPTDCVSTEATVLHFTAGVLDEIVFEGGD